MKKILTGLILIISFNSYAQEPIFATIPGGNLYSFNLTNCTRRFIGVTGQGFGDIAFTPDGQLWGIVSGNLYHIDTATANATLVGNFGLSNVSLVALNDTTLLTESGNKLYGIRTTNATAYYIDNIGFGAAGDLTWYDDDLYMVTSGGKIIKMVLNSTNTAILSITDIGNAIPTCEGAVTASFTGDYNSIVGFNGSNLIKICTIDGSYQALCPNLNLGGTPGAASIRLTSQIPPPATCTKGPLPLVLTSFNAKLQSGNVVLRWQTSQEFNTSKFIIEKSKTTYQWNEVGTVVAIGNSNSANQYLYIDSNITSSYYYRLKMIDIDGKTTYSKIEKINFKVSEQISFYPNPANDFIIINGANNNTVKKISITNSFGQRVLEITSTLNKVDLSKLTTGLYIISIESKLKKHQFKLLKE